MVMKMKMKLNLDSLAVILYTSDIIPTNIEPLTNEEWFHVEKHLRGGENHDPSRLIGMNIDTLHQILGIDLDIAKKLIARTGLLPDLIHSLHNLDSEHISITTKYENDYPQSLLKLKGRMPLILYYCGDLNLLQHDVVSIVGPQTKDKTLSKPIRKVVDKILQEKIPILVQGIKGTDEYVTQIVLKNNGKLVMMTADHMLDKMIEYKKQIRNAQMLLISAVDPYAYFNLTNSLDRNIYVCGLSNTQFVIAAHINSGPVWFTSVQNLHYQWTKPLVLTTDTDYNGNLRLIEMGAIPVSRADLLSDLSIDEIVMNNEEKKVESITLIDQMSIYEFLDD